MEILFAFSKAQTVSLATSIPVRIGPHTIRISNLELQIAYKEIILKSPKDLEDAQHLRIVAGNSLNKEKLKEYEAMLLE